MRTIIGLIFIVGFAILIFSIIASPDALPAILSWIGRMLRLIFLHS
jgi:hypothetical protein